MNRSFRERLSTVSASIEGGLLGLILSYFAGRSMQDLLAGVDPFDPSTVSITLIVAVVMTLSGSLVPAVRAMRTDPATAIRTE